MSINEGERLDVYSAREFQLTRSAAAKLIEGGSVLVNEKRVNKNYKLREGDAVPGSMPEPQLLAALPENIPLDIVYEDRDIIIVNKPRGMVVHPAAGNYTGTLVNALMYHAGGRLSAINGVVRPGIVHRIDKDTSGILAVAKTNEAHLSLAAQIKEHSMTREYLCLVSGNVRADDFTVDAPIGRHPRERKMMAVVPDGRQAVTHFHVAERLGGVTLLSCRLETGRTHQIRVHLKSKSLRIVGDTVYGAKSDPVAAKYKIGGQLLHAKKLGFIHPRTGEYVEFESPVPPDFQRVLDGQRDCK